MSDRIAERERQRACMGAREDQSCVPPPLVRARLLGRPRIYCGDVRLESCLSRQTLLLFAMLVTRKEEILSRDEVAFTLWPDLAESDARAALRRHLYRLQQALPAAAPGAWVACGTKTVSWRPAGETWVDVAEFERLGARPESLEPAAQLYAGEFLPQFDHEWALAVRERLRRRACRVLDELIRQKASGGDTLGAVHYAQELFLQDPWREDTLRQLMVLRFCAGDRAGALAYYREFRKRLQSELGVDPMPETVRCHENIACGYLPAAEWSGTFLGRLENAR